MGRSRGWTITINSPSRGTYRELDNVEAVYLVYQTERGHGQEGVEANNGTLHVQGYIYFENPKSLGGVRRLLPDGGHYEIARGSPASNQKYCTKEDTRVAGEPHQERGELPRQGARVDIAGMQVDVLALSWVEMFIKYGLAWHQYRNVLLEYKLRMETGRAWATTTTVYWGPTGTGKTHRAMEEAGVGFYIMMNHKDGGIPWADGYEGQESVIIEDYRGEISHAVLLRMTDKYKMTMQCKGGSVDWRPLHIWITSNQHPKEWYPVLEYAGGPLERRFTTNGSSVVHMRRVYVPEAE